MAEECIQKRSISSKAESDTLGRGGSERGAQLRILLAGPLPEPIGGVSVHMQRLYSWLSAHDIAVDLVDEARQHKTGIYNIRSMRPGPYLRRLTRCNLAHIQSSVHLLRILHIVMCRLFGLRVIVTIHAWNAARLATSMNRMCLRLAHQVILVHEGINDCLKLNNYRVLPAFLPPQGPRQSLPEEINGFLEDARTRGCVLLCANASELVTNEGQDLYGLDLCIELMDLLNRETDIEAAFVFVVSYDLNRNGMYADAQRWIEQRGLKSCFCLYNRPVDFVALMSQCNLVLRPTNTDGDALTIREALYMGVPVVASDVVERPPGTILFRSRDARDLMQRTLEVLRGDASHARVPAETAYDAYFKTYLDTYMDVLRSC